MLQIDPLQFLMQAIALGVWVLLAAAVYSAVESVVNPGPANPNPNNPHP